MTRKIKGMVALVPTGPPGVRGIQTRNDVGEGSDATVHSAGV